MVFFFLVPIQAGARKTEGAGEDLSAAREASTENEKGL